MTAYYNLDYPDQDSHRQQFEYLGLKDAWPKLIFVHEKTFLTSDNLSDQVCLLNKIYQEHSKLPVICLDSNPFDGLDDLANKIQQHTATPFFILGCDARLNTYTHSNVGYWPFWLIQQQTEPNYQKKSNRSARISFLSGAARPHRLKLFKKIRPWTTPQDIVIVNNYYNGSILIEHQLPWTNRPELVDVPDAATYIYTSQQNNHAAYAACVNITGETVDAQQTQQHFITEKTWKAYRSGCLVINYGIDTLPDTLKHYGIDIWKEYDVCANTDTKINRILELFQSTDIADWYHARRDQIQSNQHLVSSKSFALKFADSAIKKINCLL